MDEIECNIDEDIDNEHYTGKVINDSFINKLKDFSTFNPSLNKGRNNNSMLLPFSSIGKKERISNVSKDSFLGIDKLAQGYSSVRHRQVGRLHVRTDSPDKFEDSLAYRPSILH